MKARYCVPTNAYDDDDDRLGWYHRHLRLGEDTEITFQNITTHVARFLQEVGDVTANKQTTHD